MGPRTGMLGVPDVLPPESGWFAAALDSLLNSHVGSAARLSRSGGTYCPIKDCFVMTADALRVAGAFPEDRVFSAEMEMTRRVRASGLEVVFEPDASVWHRRVTTVAKFALRNALIARERVLQLRREKRFWRSAHAAMLAAALLAVALLAGVPLCLWAAWAASLAAAGYLLLGASLAIRTWIEKRSVAASLAVAPLMALHHATVAWGVVRGLCAGPCRS